QANPRPESHYAHGTPAINHRGVAALALIIRAPLPDRAIGLDGDIMPVPGGYHDDVAEAGAVVVELDSCRQWMGNVIACAVGGPIAELPDIISTPFPNRAIG